MRKTLLFIALVVGFSTAGLLMHQTPAHAESAWQANYWNNFCSQGRWNVGCHGYFTNAVDGCMYALPFGVPNGGCNTGPVLSTGIAVNTAAAFIATIQAGLFGGSAQDSCGAAFVIDNMLG